MWVQEPTFQDMKEWKEYPQRTVENSAKMLKQNDGTRNSETERMRRNIAVRLLPLPMKPGMESEAGAGSEQGSWWKGEDTCLGRVEQVWAGGQYLGAGNSWGLPGQAGWGKRREK